MFKDWEIKKGGYEFFNGILKDSSKKEKERLVIKYAQEGKTTREIAKLVHMSLQDIGRIIRKQTGDEKDSENNKPKEKEKKQKKLSKYAQAFQLFREKKPLTEVVIALDLDAQIVLYHYKDYLNLNRMYRLVNIYHSLGKDLSLFLHIYNRVKKEGLSREDIEDLIHIQRSIGEMQNAVGWLNKHISELRGQKEELEQEIVKLQDIKDSLENTEY